MLPSWGDEGTSGKHAVTIPRLAHFQCAQRIQAGGEGGGKFFRHVLHDDQARQGGG